MFQRCSAHPKAPNKPPSALKHPTRAPASGFFFRPEKGRTSDALLRSHWFKSDRMSTYDSLVDAAACNLRQYHGSVSRVQTTPAPAPSPACVLKVKCPSGSSINDWRIDLTYDRRVVPFVAAFPTAPLQRDCVSHNSCAVEPPDSSPSSSANTSCWSVLWFKKKKKPPTEAVTTPNLTHLHLICIRAVMNSYFNYR